MSYCVVMVTAGTEAEAEAIAIALVTAKLAACVNIFPIKSIYTWQGKIQRDTEWQLTIKTQLSYFEALSEKVRQIHSYDTPEIIALPIAEGSADYLQWITDSTQAPD